MSCIHPSKKDPKKLCGGKIISQGLANVEVHPISEEEPKGLLIIKDRMDTTRIPIYSIKWGSPDGQEPDPEENYAGMVIYDKGCFEWEESSLSFTKG